MQSDQASQSGDTTQQPSEPKQRCSGSSEANATWKGARLVGRQNAIQAKTPKQTAARRPEGGAKMPEGEARRRLHIWTDCQSGRQSVTHADTQSATQLVCLPPPAYRSRVASRRVAGGSRLK